MHPVTNLSPIRNNLRRKKRNRVGTMYTLDDDIRLYARGFYARYKEMAYSMSLRRAEELSRCGDEDGRKTWMSVAATVREIEAEHQPHVW